MLLKRRLINRIGGTKSVFERTTRAQVTQLCLDHGSQVSGRVVSKLNNFAKFTLEENHHSASDLGCRNCHKGSRSSVI